MMDLLKPYPAWQLSKYTQPFDDGKVLDEIFESRLCDGTQWSRKEYGATPEQAIERARECFEGKCECGSHQKRLGEA